MTIQMTINKYRIILCISVLTFITGIVTTVSAKPFVAKDTVSANEADSSAYVAFYNALTEIFDDLGGN